MEDVYDQFDSEMSPAERSEFKSLNLHLNTKLPENINGFKRFIAIRHAFSQFNYKSAQYRSINKINGNDVKAKNFRHDVQLIDPALHKYGQLQAVVASKLINLIDIDIVFVSPMRRTLETCKLLFQDYQAKKGKIVRAVVIPVITELFSTTGDLALETLTVVRQQFESLKQIFFDFSVMDQFNFTDQVLWNLQVLTNHSLQEQALAQISKYGPEDKVQGIIECFNKVYPLAFQRTKDTYSRSRVAHRLLEELILKDQQLLKSNGKIVIISHQLFLRSFLSEGIDSEGQLVNPVDLENCQIYPFDV